MSHSQLNGLGWLCRSMLPNTLALMLISLSALAADKAPHELIFGARTDAAPLAHKVDGEWRGYTVDLCRLIYARYAEDYTERNTTTPDVRDAHEQDLPEFKAVRAVERMESFTRGTIDILCGATTVTIKRLATVDFTLLTFASGAGIMKHKDTDSSVLSNPGKHSDKSPRITYVGCTRDMRFADCTTTQHWITKRFGGSIKPVPKPSHHEAFKALQEGQADFYIGDRVILAERLRRTKNTDEYQLAPGFLTFEPYAIAIRKGNDRLLSVANATLAELYRNPKALDDFYGRYFDTKKSRLLEAMYKLQAIPE